MKTNNQGYVKIIKDCFAYKVDAYNNVIGAVRLFTDEIFPKSGVYNYYRKSNEHWNTTHPEVFVPDLGRFELEPDSYINTSEKANYYEWFHDRFISIEGDLNSHTNVALLINLIIKPEINPIFIKIIKSKKNVS